MLNFREILWGGLSGNDLFYPDSRLEINRAIRYSAAVVNKTVRHYEKIVSFAGTSLNSLCSDMS